MESIVKLWRDSTQNQFQFQVGRASLVKLTNAPLETTTVMSMRHALEMEIHLHAVVTLDSPAMESAAKTKTNAAMEVITVMLILYAPMNLEASNVNVLRDTLMMT